jgi:hypothetical protein
MSRRGFDVSNWTGAPDRRWDALLQGDPGVLFVQSIDPPPGYPPGVTRQQVQWGLDNGWDVVAYLWKWFASGVEDMQRRLDILEPFTGRLVAVAQDVEDTTIAPLRALTNDPLADRAQALPRAHLERLNRQPPPPGPPSSLTSLSQLLSLPLEARIDQVLAAFEIIDTFPTALGQPGLYYGGRWYHVPYLGNTTAFAARHQLWTAQYDGIYDPDVVALYGGWTRSIAKQPEGTITVGMLGNVDPDVIQDGELMTPAAPPNAEPDPAWMAKKPRVVQIAGELVTVASQLEDAADEPAAVRDLAAGVRDRANEILE